MFTLFYYRKKMKEIIPFRSRLGISHPTLLLPLLLTSTTIFTSHKSKWNYFPTAPPENQRQTEIFNKYNARFISPSCLVPCVPSDSPNKIHRLMNLFPEERKKEKSHNWNE